MPDSPLTTSEASKTSPEQPEARIPAFLDLTARARRFADSAAQQKLEALKATIGQMSPNDQRIALDYLQTEIGVFHLQMFDAYLTGAIECRTGRKISPFKDLTGVKMDDDVEIAKYYEECVGDEEADQVI